MTADSLSAASLSARTNVRISGGGLFLASGGVANSMSIAGTVSASAQGRPALSAETGIEFGDGLFFLVPAGGAVGPCGDGVAVLDASGNPAETVEIGPLPPVEAALKWKYAKNANGWYCAQLALAWHPAFAEEIGNMRLLFADRTDAQGRRTAYLVDPATVIDPLGTTETYRDVEYRVAPVDLSVFADVAIGSRAVYGVSDATMASSLASVPKAERKICLRVANRDLSTVEPVANKLAILAWDVGNESFFLPLAETMSSVVDGDVAPQPAPQPAPRPLSVAEANLATAFGLAPAAVARGAVTCRIASMGVPGFVDVVRRRRERGRDVRDRGGGCGARRGGVRRTDAGREARGSRRGLARRLLRAARPRRVRRGAALPQAALRLPRRRPRQKRVLQNPPRGGGSLRVA